MFFFLIPPEKDYDAFISLLKSREWSIGICPLIANRFNSLKANTKWIEYSYCNIATVAANLDPYKYGIQDDCLLLCDTLEQWKSSLQELINRPNLIDQLVINSQNQLSSNYSSKALASQVFGLIHNVVHGT